MRYQILSRLPRDMNKTTEVWTDCLGQASSLFIFFLDNKVRPISLIDTHDNNKIKMCVE